jgi:ubiquinone/menaquinone biosynthesis C-methylase UbiE
MTNIISLFPLKCETNVKTDKAIQKEYVHNQWVNKDQIHGPINSSKNPSNCGLLTITIKFNVACLRAELVASFKPYFRRTHDMSLDKSETTVSSHYAHGSLLNAIKNALHKIGKTPDAVTIEDLAPVDEFHIGGRTATDNLISQLSISESHQILDIGCGLGGAARYVAKQTKASVTGIDLTGEYIETGNALCQWLQLNNQVSLDVGSALNMPYESNSFDGAYMLHVGMNIEDKHALFAEVYRVLKPGASFGVYDIMRQSAGDLAYPCPWASENGTCQIAKPEQYITALEKTGFEVAKQSNRREFALEFFKMQKEKIEANGGPLPIGLHILMQDSAAEKLKNMVSNLTKGYIAPVEIIVRKPKN